MSSEQLEESFFSICESFDEISIEHEKMKKIYKDFLRKMCNTFCKEFITSRTILECCER